MPKLKAETIIPTDEESLAITSNAMTDPDAIPLTDDEWNQVAPVARIGRPKAEQTKDRINIRLSHDVTEYFRATGKGWQTRIDEVLRKYVETHK
jgi:uncharacterized protein (DUF4415 family)